MNETVLLVARNSEFAEPMACMLEGDGYVAVHVENAEKAAAELRSLKPDVLLCDLCGATSGEDDSTVKLLKGLDPEVPVVLLPVVLVLGPASQADQTAVETLKRRPARVLVRPVSTAAILEAVQDVLSGQTVARGRVE